MKRNLRNSMVAGAAVGGVALVAAAVAVAGPPYTIDGSTLSQPAVNKWCTTGPVRCSDAGGGSGKGLTDFQANNVDWAGSDAPLTTAPTGTAASAGVNYYAPLVGGIAIPVNLPGIKNLKLQGGTLAQIFDGQITKWNNSAIKSLNPNYKNKLPNTTIVECVRADSSGTSYNFTNFLIKVNPGFRSAVTPVPSKTPNFKGTVIKASGGGGVASCVASQPNAIGYVDFANTIGVLSPSKLAAIGHKVSGVKGVVYTTPSTASITAAAAKAAKVKGLSLSNPIGFQYALLNTNSKAAYPIALTTFILGYNNYSGINTSRESGAQQFGALKSFLGFALSKKGQALLPGQGFSPVPTSWITLNNNQLKKVKP